MVGGVTASPLFPVRNATHTGTDDFSNCAEQFCTQNSITIHPLITYCTQGRPLNLTVFGGRFVATFPASPRESVPAAAAPLSPKPQPNCTDHSRSPCADISVQPSTHRQASTYAVLQDITTRTTCRCDVVVPMVLYRW